jgi:hypothetical protein
VTGTLPVRGKILPVSIYSTVLPSIVTGSRAALTGSLPVKKTLV